MKVSMYMMADALASFCAPGRLTVASERICIDAVMPYEQERALEEGVLYVAEADDCAEDLQMKGRCCYLIVVGDALGRTARAGCECLVAREGLGFSEVLTAALQTMRAFGSWHARLTDELLAGCDLNSLCEIGSDLLNLPIMIYDKSYAVIGNSIPEDDATFEELLVKRSSYYVTRPELMRALTQQQQFQDTFKARGAALYSSDGDVDAAFKGSSLYVNIGKGSVYRGRVVIPCEPDEVRRGDYQIAEIFCEAVRAAIRRPSLRQGDLDRIFRAYFSSLLDGRAIDDRLLADSLRLWNWERIGHYACFWAELTHEAIAVESDSFLCYQLEMELEGCCAVRYGDGIACVAPVGDAGYEGSFECFRKLASGMVSAIGASEEYVDILLTGEYFIEARVAVEMCSALGVEACRFGDIALRHYHQNGCSRLPAEHFCDADVKALMAYRGKRKDYYEVLKCYLEHSMNLLRTSEALFIHRTTLFNYLKEIRGLIGADLDKPQDRLRMLASFEIMAQAEGCD